MPKVELNDIEMYYEVHGEGVPVMIINGFGGTSEGWESVSPLITDLSKRYKVIIQDNRGVGRSTISDKPVTIKLMAQDKVALLDKLGIEAAYFIGNSMGGMIAQEIALNYPERVLGIILSATSPGGECYKIEGQLEKIHMISWNYEPPKELTQGEIMEKFADVVWSPDFYRDNKERLNEYVPEYPAPASTLRRYYDAVLNHDTCDRLSSISSKTLVLHGGQDGLVFSDSAYYMVKKIPNSELFLIKDARHGVLEERWDEVYGRLLEFIAPLN